MALNIEKLMGRDGRVADDFDRTIIGFESPCRLKDLTPSLGGDPDVHEERMSEKAFKLRFAQHDEVFNSASLLVQKRYEWRGMPKAKLAKHPNRVTILTFFQEKIVGTVTVGYDSEEGLLADEMFKPEVDGLRAQGRRIGELSKLAIDENIGSKQLLASLVHVAYLYGVIHECTDAVFDIVPHHKAFYERMLGLTQVGDVVMSKRVHVPVMLMHIELEYMRKKIEEFGGKGKTVKERSLYPYFFSPRDQEGILARLMRDEE